MWLFAFVGHLNFLPEPWPWSSLEVSHEHEQPPYGWLTIWSGGVGRVEDGVVEASFHYYAFSME